MFIKVVFFILFFSLASSQDLNSKMDELKFISMMFEEESLLNEGKNDIDIELIDVRCFWVKGWNVYDISSLERSQDDWNITTTSGQVFFNFCTNTKKTCQDTNPTIMLGIDNAGSCHRLAGNDTQMNGFALKNSSDPNSGLIVSLSSGQFCNEEDRYNTTFVLDCDPTMKSGELELYNKEEFNINQCKNVLRGKTREVCPKLNYYILSYFFEKYNIFLGLILIVIGFFLIMFGAKFFKITFVLAAVLASVTILTLVVFNLFTITTNTMVWVILGIGICIGLAISYFLINLAILFVMTVGGYMGYTLGIFLYHLVLDFVHASPEVVYWATIIICVIICALIALWAAKHIMIIGTSLGGGYAVIRGASLYLGNFPSETVVIDLIKHNEWDQLSSMLNEYIYFYLAVWFILTISGLVAQYKINSDKRSDDYRRIE